MSLRQRSTWHKLFVCLLGIAIVVGIWQWATWHLYSLPPESISAFTSITTSCLYVISSIVMFFITGKVLYDWKNTTESAVSLVSQHIDEQRKEEIDETIREFNTPELQDRYSDR